MVLKCLSEVRLHLQTTWPRAKVHLDAALHPKRTDMRDLAVLLTPQSRQSSPKALWVLAVPDACDLEQRKPLEQRKWWFCLLSQAFLPVCSSPRAADLLAFESQPPAFLPGLHPSMYGPMAVWSSEVWSRCLGPWPRPLSVSRELHQPGLLPPPDHKSSGCLWNPPSLFKEEHYI